MNTKIFMKSQKGIHNQEGFTLIELILYVAIISFILLSITSLIVMLFQVRVKNQTVVEVNQQGAQIVHLISQTIRSSEGITAPVAGATASSATFDVITVADDPTIFDISSGAIRITEGAGSATPLSNSRVTASGLSFQNISRINTPGIIKFEFTLTHVNPENRNEYDYAKTFYATAAVRTQ